jgi:hypothetical protein
MFRKLQKARFETPGGVTRPKQEKVFGSGRGILLDGNTKARLNASMQGYPCYRQQGQHRGPITRAYMEVVEAMLFGFHNSKTGLRFPRYEALVEGEMLPRYASEQIKPLL